KSFGSLTHLDLFNNDICKMEDYRSKVFKLIGSLKFLDGYDLEENEAEESDSDEGGANGVPASEDADEDLEDEDDIGDEEEDDLEEEEDDLEEEEEEDDDDGPGLASIYNTNFNDVEDGDYECMKTQRTSRWRMRTEKRMMKVMTSAKNEAIFGGQKLIRNTDIKKKD
ncbi:Acidic leucine-rich nuclear phosphoprotein 32 family member A, partial [Caligus rogercresseyi]